MSDRSVAVVFDCGKLGKVRWELPRGLVDGRTDPDIQARVLAFVGPQMPKVLNFFLLVMACKQPTTAQAALKHLSGYLYHSTARIQRKLGQR